MMVFMMMNDGFHDVVHTDINGGFHDAMGIPPARWMVYFIENPTKTDDDWG